MKASYVLAVLALAGCTEATAPTGHSSPTLSTKGRADMILNETTPIPFIPVTGCHEPVYLSGTLHSMFEITRPSNGSVHIRVTNHYTLTGVGGVTGTTYVGELRSVDEQIVNSGAATVFDISGSGRLIAKGNVPNTAVDFKTAFTLNANGEITHSGDTFRVRCD